MNPKIEKNMKEWAAHKAGRAVMRLLRHSPEAHAAGLDAEDFMSVLAFRFAEPEETPEDKARKAERLRCLIPHPEDLHESAREAGDVLEFLAEHLGPDAAEADRRMLIVEGDMRLIVETAGFLAQFREA